VMRQRASRRVSPLDREPADPRRRHDDVRPRTRSRAARFFAKRRASGSAARCGSLQCARARRAGGEGHGSGDLLVAGRRFRQTSDRARAVEIRRGAWPCSPPGPGPPWWRGASGLDRGSSRSSTAAAITHSAAIRRDLKRLVHQPATARAMLFSAFSERGSVPRSGGARRSSPAR
jgi:hypothetical protein